MGNPRIVLDEEGFERYNEENADFETLEVVRIRAKDRKEAREIAGLVSEKFGDSI